MQLLIPEPDGSGNFDGLAKLDRPKSPISEVALQAIEVNLVSSSIRVSGELGISKF